MICKHILLKASLNELKLLAMKYCYELLSCYFLAKCFMKNKGERRTKISKSFYGSFNSRVEERVYVYAASLVGRKEGRK